MAITQCKAYKVLLATLVDAEGISIYRCRYGRPGYFIAAYMPSKGMTQYMHEPRHVVEFIKKYGQ